MDTPNENQTLEDQGFVDNTSAENEAATTGGDNVEMDDSWVDNTSATAEAGSVETATEETPEGTPPSTEGGNAYINAFSSWAERQGFDVDTSSFDAENFGEEQMNEKVGQLQAERYLDKVDPRIKYMVQHKLKFEDFVQEQNRFVAQLQQTDDQLVNRRIIDLEYQKMANLGQLQAGEDGKLTQESFQRLQQAAATSRSHYSQEQIAAMAANIRKGIEQQSQQMPERLKTFYEQEQQKVVKQYNERTQQRLQGYKEHLKNQKSYVADFSDQSPKDKFLDYAKEQLSLTDPKDGVQQVKFFNRLENDENFLRDMLRLSQLHDGGYFTDLRNGERKRAFGELSIGPIVSGGKQERSRKSKGGWVDNTSEEAEKASY